MKKLFLSLFFLFCVAPMCAVGQSDQNRYVVDLYTAVKNNTGLLSYFIWRTSAEKDAVKAAEAAGVSLPAAYLEAADYAYDLGDARTAASLKQSYARQYLFSLPVTVALCAVTAAGFKLVQHRLAYIKDSAYKYTPEEIEDLRTRLPGFKVFNQELKAMNEPQIQPKGFPDQNDIRAAHRKLAKRWHPDKNIGNEKEAAAKFVKIDDAYKILNKKPDDKQD